jgi:hypothetical protein
MATKVKKIFNNIFLMICSFAMINKKRTHEDIFYAVIYGIFFYNTSLSIIILSFITQLLNIESKLFFVFR